MIITFKLVENVILLVRLAVLEPIIIVLLVLLQMEEKLLLVLLVFVLQDIIRLLLFLLPVWLVIILVNLVVVVLLLVCLAMPLTLELFREVIAFAWINTMMMEEINSARLVVIFV